jgi:hypothetical protein
MNNHRRSSTVECGIRQVNVRKIENQQHQKDEAAEYHQPGRVDVPSGHASFFLPDERNPVNHYQGSAGRAGV